VSKERYNISAGGVNINIGSNLNKIKYEIEKSNN
jgi:hypothetical protein